MHSVPFSISDAYEGLVDVDGLVWFDADVLTLEFQTKDAFFGLIKSNVQNVQLSLTDLASVHFAKKIFRATLTLRVHRLALVAQIYNASSASLEYDLYYKGRFENALEPVQLKNLPTTDIQLIDVVEQWPAGPYKFVVTATDPESKAKVVREVSFKVKS